MRPALLALCVLLLSEPVSGQFVFRRSGVPTGAAASLTITTTSLPDATEDEAYSFTVQASGGGGGDEWDSNGAGACAGGFCNLNDADTDCAGLKITQATGEIVGPATDDDGGACSVTTKVTDDLSATATASFTLTVIEAAAVTCPSPWTGQDIGSGQAPGSCAESLDVFTIEGAGTGLGTSDKGYLVSQAVTGDFSVAAQVTACTGAIPLCGVTIRSSTTANSARVYCGRQIDGTPLFRYRPTDGAASQSATVATITPAYFMAVNIGGQLSCLYGDDGLAWSQVGASQAITLASTYRAGMWVLSSPAEEGNLTTGTFANVVTDTTPDNPEEAADSGAYRPHYQGPGTTTRAGAGGTGGRVYIVNTTADNTTAPVLVDTVGGVGIYTSSFRAALNPSTCTPRYIVFSTSGTFYFTIGGVDVNCPFLTVAAQTAPSPGVTWAQRELRINTNDVVFQHIRGRRGDLSNQGERALWVHGGDGASGGAATFNVVLDHLSVSWGTDETLGFGASGNPGPQDITVLDSLASEPLDNPDGRPPNHARMTSSNPRPNGTILMTRTIYAHSDTRNPSVRSGWQWAHVNNLLYNYRGNIGGTNHGGIVFQCLLSETNLIEGVAIGNVFIPGPETPSGHIPIKASDGSTGTCPIDLFVEDNRCTGATCPSAYATTGAGQCTTPSLGDNQWLGVYRNNLTEAAVREDCRPSWFTGQTTGTVLELDSSTVRAYVLANSGARPLDRDLHDTRIIAEITAGTGGSIKDSLDVAGSTCTGPCVTPPANEVTTGGNVAALAENSNHSALLTAIQAIDPDDPGTCGSMFDGFVRTEMMCLLESHASHGAQRLEMYQGAP